MGGKARDIFGTVLGFAALAASGGALGPAIGMYSGLLTASAVAYGAWSAKEARRKAELAAEKAREGRKAMLRGGAVAKYIVYGREWVPGVVAGCREPQSKADPYFWLVLALPVAHKIESIEQIWFGDDPITPLTEDGSARPGPFNKEFTKSDILTGIVPADRIVTVQGKEEDRKGSIDSTGPIRLAVTNPTPTIVTGEDTYQDVINPDATATKISATQIRLDGAEPGQQYTITYSYKFTRVYIKCWQYFGDDEQTANADFIAATAHLHDNDIAKWKSSDKLNGVPYVIFRFHVDKDVFPNLLENISFQIQGKRRVLDTRSGAEQWTDNSALCVRDYAVNECGVLPGEISLPHFHDHVNYCDIVQNITLPDGSSADEYMYRTNIALSTEAKPIDNLGLLLSTCDGSVVPSGSSFDIRVGSYEEPVVELDDSDFAGPPEIVKGLSKLELFNGVRARYQNSAKPYWPMEDAPAYLSEYYKARQGGVEVVRELDLKGTASAYMAHRICKQTLLRAMQGLRIKAMFNTKVMQLTPEQTVWLNCRSLGMEDKVFRIKSIRPNGLHQFELEMQEDGPLLYEWDFDEAAGVDPAPNTNLPRVRNVPLIQGLGAYADERAVVTGPDGNVVPCCVVFWNPVTDMFVLNGGHIELRYKRTQDPHWTVVPNLEPTARQYRFPIQRGDVLIIEVRLANSLYKGEWTQIKRTTEDTPSPYIVSANEIKNAKLEWTDTYTFGTEGQYTGYTFPNWTAYGPLGSSTTWPYVFYPLNSSTVGAPPQPGAVLIGHPEALSSLTNGAVEWMQSDLVPVTPGKRMLFFTQILWGEGRTVLVQIRYVSHKGALVADQYGTAHPESEVTVSNYESIESWPTILYFSRVPSNAYAAQLRIVSYHVTNGPMSSWWVRRPFFGEAAEGQISLPPWRA